MQCKAKPHTCSELQPSECSKICIVVCPGKKKQDNLTPKQVIIAVHFFQTLNGLPCWKLQSIKGNTEEIFAFHSAELRLCLCNAPAHSLAGWSRPKSTSFTGRFSHPWLRVSWAETTQIRWAWSAVNIKCFCVICILVCQHRPLSTLVTMGWQCMIMQFPFHAWQCTFSVGSSQ